MSNKTPSAKWRENGDPDPHGNHYNCERAQLALGDMTDDELANALFIHGDIVPPIEDVIAGKAKMPITYLTAGKERIRWLSRRLVETASQRDALLAATEEIIRISDRQHDAWDAAKAVIAEIKGGNAAQTPDRLGWLESMHTLHGAVEILYVVDGYQLTLTCDDEPVGEPVHGATLNQAIDNAIAAGWKPLKKGW